MCYNKAIVKFDSDMKMLNEASMIHKAKQILKGQYVSIASKQHQQQ